MHLQKYVCFAVVVLLLTGCQSTPEQDVIANKNDHQVSEAEQSDSVATSGDQSADGTKIVSEAISETFDADAEGVSISVKADEVKGKNVPVVQAAPQEISADDVKRWSEVFFGTEDVYEYKDEMTKSEIEEEILWRQQDINDRDRLLAEGYSEEDADVMIELYKEQIENLKANYDNAPDEDARKKTDWTFHPGSYWMKDETYGDGNDWSKEDQTESLKITGTYEGKNAHISASNRNGNDFQVHDIYFSLNEELDIQYNAKSSISREEALQMTDEKLKALTNKEWQVDWVENNGNQWRIRYVPVLNQLPCLQTDMAFDSTDSYAANLEYEKIEFSIVDGLIDSVEWDSPMRITSTEDQPATMMSFDEIYKAFKNYMQVKCTLNSLGLMTDDPEEDGVAGVQAYANITDISQMYCRVKVKNTDQSYQYVPAFVFSGYTSQGDYKEDDWVNRYCVVNALDGTIINTWLGY